MKEKNLSLYRLSLQSGISYSTLHDIIATGKVKNPKLDTATKIANALEEKLEELI